MSRPYIENMRQRLDLEPYDTSRDVEIEAMTPEDRLKLLCAWELGFPDWAYQFLSWARACGYKITEE